MSNTWSAFNINQAPGSIQGVDDNIILYVRIDGNDDTGDGSLAKPFATPNRAMDRCRDFYISENGGVTIDCGPGEYTLTKTIVLNHPQGKRIEIRGAGTEDADLDIKGVYGVTFDFDDAPDYADVGGEHKAKLIAGRLDGAVFTTEHGLTDGSVESDFLMVYNDTLWNDDSYNMSKFFYGSQYDKEWGNGNTAGGLSNNAGWSPVAGEGTPGGSGGCQWLWLAGTSRITGVEGAAARGEETPGPENSAHIQIALQFKDHSYRVEDMQHSSTTESQVGPDRAHRTKYNDPQEDDGNENNIGLISTFHVPHEGGHTSGFVPSTEMRMKGKILKTIFKWTTYDRNTGILLSNNSTFGPLKNLVLMSPFYEIQRRSATCITIRDGSNLSVDSDAGEYSTHLAFLNWYNTISISNSSGMNVQHSTFNNCSYGAYVSYSHVRIERSHHLNTLWGRSIYGWASDIWTNRTSYNNNLRSSGGIELQPNFNFTEGDATISAGDYVLQQDGDNEPLWWGVVTGVNDEVKHISVRAKIYNNDIEGVVGTTTLNSKLSSGWPVKIYRSTGANSPIRTIELSDMIAASYNAWIGEHIYGQNGSDVWTNRCIFSGTSIGIKSGRTSSLNCYNCVFRDSKHGVYTLEGSTSIVSRSYFIRNTGCGLATYEQSMTQDYASFFINGRYANIIFSLGSYMKSSGSQHYVGRDGYLRYFTIGAHSGMSYSSRPDFFVPEFKDTGSGYEITVQYPLANPSVPRGGPEENSPYVSNGEYGILYGEANTNIEGEVYAQGYFNTNEIFDSRSHYSSGEPEDPLSRQANFHT